MGDDYTSLKLPLNAENFLSSLALEQCSVEESIAGHIHVLLTTAYGECKFDEGFGCEIWDHEFEHSQISKIWMDRVALKIQSALEKYETRLNQLKVEANITEEELEDKSGIASVRLQKCLNLSITGRLSLTNEPFYFKDKIYISPFAMD